jgi:outer membrane protein assembly factor BamC
MSSIRFPVLLVAITALGGCGLFGDQGMFRDRRNDYLGATETAPLKVPEGVKTEAIQDYYFVPEIDENAQAQPNFEVPRPLRLVAGDSDNMVKIQSLGDDRWILIRQVPGQVWSSIRDFLLINRVSVALEDGNSGVLETPWMVPQGSSDYERYRFALRQGLQRNSSEITVLNQTVSPTSGGEAPSGLPWPEVSTDPEKAKVFLDTLAQYLAENAEAAAAVSLKAQEIDTSSRLYVANDPVPHITLELGRERAWASLGYALDKAGFTIDDEDAGQGVYQTTYSGRPDAGEDEGFWSSLMGLGQDERTPVSYRVLLKPGAKAGWMEIYVEKDGEFRETELELVINEIKGYLT